MYFVIIANHERHFCLNLPDNLMFNTYDVEVNQYQQTFIKWKSSSSVYTKKM